MAGRTGRRPGNPDTKAHILAVARDHFMRQGVAATSIRGIAREAGVDPALVHHYFADKNTLFLAALEMAFDPALLVERIASGGVDGIGVRIINAAIMVWESPMGATLIRAAAAEPHFFPTVGAYLVEHIVQTAIQVLRLPRAEAEERGALMQSLMLGMAMTRYIARIEPMVSLPREQLVRIMAPILQHIITGNLDGRRRPQGPSTMGTTTPM